MSAAVVTIIGGAAFCLLVDREVASPGVACALGIFVGAVFAGLAILREQR